MLIHPVLERGVGIHKKSLDMETKLFMVCIVSSPLQNISELV